TGIHPFEGATQNETIANIKSGKSKPLPSYIQGDFKDILLSMIEKDATKRPSAKDLLDTDLMKSRALIENLKIQKGLAEDLTFKAEEKAEMADSINQNLQKELNKMKSKHVSDAVIMFFIFATLITFVAIWIITYKSNTKIGISLKEANERINILEKPNLILLQMAKILKQPVIGSEEEQEEIRRQKKEICALINSSLYKREDNELRKKIINKWNSESFDWYIHE
ncbi:MAG: hypothetical protein EZS28_044431, partial [Streblomastix strix]